MACVGMLLLGPCLARPESRRAEAHFYDHSAACTVEATAAIDVAALLAVLADVLVAMRVAADALAAAFVDVAAVPVHASAVLVVVLVAELVSALPDVIDAPLVAAMCTPLVCLIGKWRWCRRRHCRPRRC